MTDLRKAAQQALEAWDASLRWPFPANPHSSMEALREALAQPKPAMYSSSLQCGWVAWTVVDAGVLRLDMPDTNVCDMRGAIKAAEALCPMVWRIDTYSGGKPDTMYVLRRGGWECVDRRSADLLFRTYPAIVTWPDSEGGGDATVAPPAVQAHAQDGRVAQPGVQLPGDANG